MRRSQVVLLALLAASGVAAAAPSVGVVVTGDPGLQGKIRTQVGNWLQQHGFTLNAKALAPDAVKTLTSCFVIEDMACARGVVEHQATSDFLVFVRVELVGGKRAKEANLVAYWFLKDRDAAVDKRNCKPCTGAMLARTTGELIGAIYDETALSKARLSIKEPPNLVVMLDGVNVGVTPLDRDVSPGSHAIALVRDDLMLGTVSIDVKAGDLTEVKVPIKAPVPMVAGAVPMVAVAPPPPRDEPPEHRSHLLPGLVLVAGAGAVVTGGVFLYYGHKGGPDEPLVYPHASRQGAIIAGAGGAALVTGLLLWWHASAATNGPTASVSPAGTMVGWAGQF